MPATDGHIGRLPMLHSKTPHMLANRSPSVSHKKFRGAKTVLLYSEVVWENAVMSSLDASGRFPLLLLVPFCLTRLTQRCTRSNLLEHQRRPSLGGAPNLCPPGQEAKTEGERGRERLNRVPKPGFRTARYGRDEGRHIECRATISHRLTPKVAATRDSDRKFESDLFVADDEVGKQVLP